MRHPTRRQALQFGVATATLMAVRPPSAAAEADAGVHGLSVFGDLKYPADFPHFDYVNIDAPKGGVFSTSCFSASRATIASCSLPSSACT